MVVVISMILILLAIALPMYNQAIVRAREAKLHENLVTLNKLIQEYSLDKKKAPQSLDDLVPAYLKSIPEDITGKTDTWVTETEDPENAWDTNQTGISGVHSGSNEPSSDGSPYSSWTH
jgi:general secretion pathway protein G